MQRLDLDLQQSTHDWQEVSIDQDSQLVATYIGKGNSHLIAKLKLLHSSPGVTSRIYIKAVLFDNAKVDLEAVLAIAKTAQDTNTYLKMDCLLMSSTASARAVPSLEILADQVKAGHGATIATLDKDYLHYLTSRGLSTKQAERELIKAFIAIPHNAE